MSHSLDRRKFLKMTGAAGFGLGLFNATDFANAGPVESSSEREVPRRHRVQPEGPYSTRFEWSGPDLWYKTVTNGLRRDGEAVILDDHILVEDDAPAIGVIQDRAWEHIEDGTVLEKHLQIDRWPVRDAQLTMLVYPVQPAELYSGASLEVQINGNEPIVYEVGHVWTSIPVPGDQLRFGTNRILVTVHGEDTVFRMPIALADYYHYGSDSREAPSPQRSRRSTNRGGTWSEELGTGGVNGEYPIRLTLRSHRPDGWLQTPVIDLTDSPSPFHHPATVEQVRVDLQLIRRGDDSSVSVWTRSGETHRPEAGGWSDWERLRLEELPRDRRKRFVQLKVYFESESGDSTPQLESIRVEGRVRPEENRPTVHFLDGLNRPLIDKPYMFEHEDPLYEELQDFRKQYRLDDVVRGARNETERILRLRNWSAGRWNWFLPDADRDPVIAWDSDSILTADETGEFGGFCLYFAVVFAQACQSFGIPARMVTINYSVWGGHEVVEVWSRDYQKWFMVDPQFDSVFVSTETGEPKSVLELHDIFLETYYPGGEILDRDAWTIEERDRRSSRVDPEEIPIRFQTDGYALSGELDSDYVWWRVTEEEPAPGYAGGYGFFNTAYVRWVPRSNWFSRPYPMPISHGRTHWGWDGYLAWTDDQTPRTQEHRHFLSKEQEIYDRLFTVDYSAEPMEDDGAVRVWLATESPGFSHFELIQNGRRRTTRSPSFRWDLARGVNRLEMRSVDVLGNRGPASELTVNYMPV